MDDARLYDLWMSGVNATELAAQAGVSEVRIFHDLNRVLNERAPKMNDPGPMPAFLDRTKTKPLVGSYSMLAAYKNCPHAMFRRYIKKDQPFVETPEMKWGNQVHTAFELRIGGGKPLPVEMSQWERFAKPFDGRGAVVEQKLGITREGKPCGFFDDEVWFRGKIDVALIGDAQAYIGDFKTGKSSYEDPLELATGAMLLRAKHLGCTTIKAQYMWLKEDRLGQMYDVSDARGTFLKVRTMMDEIEQIRASGEAEKQKSGLCSWCSVKDCENWRERT